MPIAGRREAQQFLQQAMNGGGVKQIEAAHDIADALRMIVDNDRQMIAGGRIPALENRVTPDGGISRFQRFERALALRRSRRDRSSSRSAWLFETSTG